MQMMECNETDSSHWPLLVSPSLLQLSFAIESYSFQEAISISCHKNDLST